MTLSVPCACFAFSYLSLELGADPALGCLFDVPLPDATSGLLFPIQLPAGLQADAAACSHMAGLWRE